MRQGVLDALDIANLVQQLQEERAAVALNNFLLDVDDADKQTNLDTIKEITGTELFLTLPGSRELLNFVPMSYTGEGPECMH